MMLPKSIFAVFFLIITYGVFAQRKDFADVLTIRNTVTDTNDIEKNCFSDLGAWHAYSLPKSKKDYGSFTGPLLMDMSGQWLANNIAQLYVVENGNPINFENSKASLHYYPGLLNQQLETEGLRVTMRLIFVSNREAMLEAKVTNLTAKKRQLQIGWKGKALLSSAKLEASSNGLLIKFLNNDHRFEIDFDKKQRTLINGDTYDSRVGTIELKPGGVFSTTQVQRYLLQSSEEQQKNHYVFSSALKENDQRWNGYLQRYFSVAALNKDEKKLAVKAMVTLITNWRSKAKDLKHDGVFPSINYQGFYGVWSWDSWKQAVGLALFNPALAVENVQCMFDYQDAHGMVADCVYTDKKENNWRDTKPPLAAWAVWNIYEATRDTRFIKSMYPRLVKYHQWWYVYRDHDKNGLCEYGSTDGTRIAAAWESGMDNAVRFDSAVMIQNGPHAWSLNQESVDLNAYLYAEKIYLSKLAKVLLLHEEAEAWRKQAGQLSIDINKQFFDNEKGYYYDQLYNKNERIIIEGTEGWIPLWAGIASAEQGKAVAKIMMDARKFNTLVPLPTLTADHPKFDPMNGYWRGPVWLDQFYFGIEGLRNYGYKNMANELVNKLWENAEGMKNDRPFFENYHPVTGKGLNAINFSWSAAHTLLLLKLK